MANPFLDPPAKPSKALNPFLDAAAGAASKPVAAAPNPFLEPAGVEGRAPPAAGAEVVAPRPAPSAPTTYKFNPAGFIPRTFGPGGLHDVYKGEIAAGQGAMHKGAQDIKGGKYLQGGLEYGVGALGYLASPVSALAKTYVGDPLRRGTGSPTLGNIGEFLATAAIPGPKVKAAVTATPAGREVVKTAEKIFDPTKVSPLAGEAGGAIRKATGEAARRTEQTRAALAEHTLQLDQAPQHWMDVVNQMEGQAHNTPTTLSPLVQTMKTAYDERKRMLESLPSTAQMNFVQDYFPHAWERAGAPVLKGAPKQGATGFTKGREIPTVADGMTAGLVPKSMNPIDATMAYIENADRFIATNTVFDEARAAGTVKYFAPGKAPPGMTKLEGRLTQKGPMQAYAPDDF
ncbi:MAG: hypothetical protein WC718_19415, partial [Phycisphaerales bacterium]